MSRAPRGQHMKREEQLEQGQRMLRLREEEGLMNTQLAIRFGVGKSTVSNWIKLALALRGKKT